jgi:AraC-like DNA-binding protein
VADALLESTAEAMRVPLLAAHAQPLKRALEPHLSRFVTGNALTLIRAAAEVVVDGGTLKELGRIFDSSERTVAGWCARESLPPPRRLLAWMRLLLALTLLEEPHRSVVNAATCSGYLDYSLRRAVRLFLGGGGFIRGRTLEHAMAVFNDELRMLREKVRADQRSRRVAER